jgi:hypothetical protein
MYVDDKKPVTIARTARQPSDRRKSLGKVYLPMNVCRISLDLWSELAGLPFQSETRQRNGVTVIWRRAAMRSSSGGWVLNRADSVPWPKNGFTMHSEDVLGEIADVGMRLL